MSNLLFTCLTGPLFKVRAIKEGWFPEIAPPNVASETLYGSCLQIYDRTTESNDIVHTYPWGDPAYWRGRLVNETNIIEPVGNATHKRKFTLQPNHHWTGYGAQIILVACVALLIIGWRQYSTRNRKKWEYTEIST